MGNRPPYPGTPRWVKTFGIIAIIVVLLIAIMLLTGHGPGRHTSSGHAGGHVSSSGAMNWHELMEGGRG